MHRTRTNLEEFSITFSLEVKNGYSRIFGKKRKSSTTSLLELFQISKPSNGKSGCKMGAAIVLDLDNPDHFALNHQYLEIEKYMVTKALKSWDIDLQLSWRCLSLKYILESHINLKGNHFTCCLGTSCPLITILTPPMMDMGGIMWFGLFWVHRVWKHLFCTYSSQLRPTKAQNKGEAIMKAFWSLTNTIREHREGAYQLFFNFLVWRDQEES